MAKCYNLSQTSWPRIYDFKTKAKNWQNDVGTAWSGSGAENLEEEIAGLKARETEREAAIEKEKAETQEKITG